MTDKKTEPGAGTKHDDGKPRTGLVLGGFAKALMAITDVGTAGAKEYGDDNWKEVPDGQERYTDAMIRHLLKEATGEVIDPGFGLLHAAHTAWNGLARLELLIEEIEREKGDEQGREAISARGASGRVRQDQGKDASQAVHMGAPQPLWGLHGGRDPAT
jgi:hypothetical protein